LQRSDFLAPAEGPGASLRELTAAREIAHAFLTSRSPGDVYRLALERVAPLVGAELGCVYQREDEDTLRLAAAWNWPRDYAAYLGEMRVRVGNGPTGRAVAEGGVVEVFDVFADASLADWWDAARELGFASSISLPLTTGGSTVGAINFYFREPETLGEGDRDLLRLVADQLAATAEKAHLIEDLQRANAQLRDQNVELEARYREAEEARRLKTEFLANVSHELRTPLTAVLGYSYLLREGLSGELHAEQLAAVDKIEQAGGELMALINDLLDLTNLKLGRTTIVPEECDAVALARAALSSSPAPPHLEVRTEAPATAVPLHTDPSQAVRILRGLLSNAYKFTAAGSVTLRVLWLPPEEGASVGRVVFEVEDTGIGIEPHHLDAVFDEFRQVDGSVTRRFGGTGMGLSIARQLARKLGGDVTVRSTPGQGSVFALTLPAWRLFAVVP
jgi:signal transduction histidine kinase